MDELNAVTNEMVRLIETSKTPILAFDAYGLVNGWNKKFVKHTELSVKEVLGKPMINIVDETLGDNDATFGFVRS